MLEAQQEAQTLREERDDYSQRLAATADSWRLLSIERDAYRRILIKLIVRMEGDYDRAKAAAEARAEMPVYRQVEKC